MDVEVEWMWREGGGCGRSVDVEGGRMLRMGGGCGGRLVEEWRTHHSA